MTPAEFADQLSAFVAAFHARVESRDGKHFLQIPGYEPLPWRAAIKKKFLSRRNPNDIFYEEAATAAFTFCLSRLPVSTVIDAGAQWGYFSALALAYVERPIKPIAFEINPHAPVYLEGLIAEAEKRGRHGEIMLSGLSDSHVGERDIWISTTRMFESEPTEADYRDPWWVRLKMAMRGNRDRDVPQKFRVLITSLDHFCRERNVVPELIKIDVDGYEAKVIPGAMEVLSRHKPIVFLELHKKKFIARFGVTRRDIVKPLFDMGYQAVLIDDHHDRSRAIVPVTLDSPEIAREATDMFIFFHPTGIEKISAS
jgi:FkbM family methyltransferase